MPTSVVLPKFDRLMTEGVILSWLKKPGEKVKKGEPISLIETEKVTVELEAPESGMFFAIAPEHSNPKVGEVIALILAPGEKPPDGKPQIPSPREIEVASRIQMREAIDGKLIPATPAARKLARELGVNLAEVKLSHPASSIMAEDVADHAKKVKNSEIVSVARYEASQEHEEVIPMTGWRKVMAERVAQSTVTTARVTTVAEVDATEMRSLKEKLAPLDKEIGARITYTTFIVKAAAHALREFPIINSSLVDDNIRIHKHVNVGVAVAIEKGGLVVPVIRDADNKDLFRIAQELDDLSGKARNNRLTLQDISDGTFTITNPGIMGVILDTPIINIPQCAVLGVGAIVKRPCVVADQLAIRYSMYLSLSYDHRITEGMPAIRFLQRVRQLIESPYPALAGRISKQ